MRKISAAAWSCFGIVAVLVSNAHASSYQAYNTGNKSELITSLPINDTKYVMYSQALNSLGNSDILIVNAEGEFTNDTGAPAHVNAELLLTCSASATTGHELDRQNGFNITPDMHHGVRIKPATQAFPTGGSCSGTNYVNLVVEANEGTSGDSLTVEQGYGQLQIVQISP